MNLNNFDTLVSQIMTEYYNQVDRNKLLRKQLEEYNKDNEIQKYKNKLEYIRKHSLLQMSDKELEREKAFRKKHYELHHPGPDMKINLTDSYIYELSGTGIGTIIKITCPICGESEDITDTESW